MTNLFQKSIVLPGIVLLFCCAVLFVGGILSARVLAAATSSSSGERLLTIHDGTATRGILTRASTLRQAFKEAKVSIDASDLIEPGLDEQLMANNYDINVYRARPVTVVDGAVRKKIMSAYRTPEQIVTHAGMTLQEEDSTRVGLPADLASSGATIELTITRATPFTLVLYGKKVDAYTQAKTVATMLKDKNITLGKDDSLSVVGSDVIRSGMTVELWRNGKQTITEEQDVAFEVEKIQDMDRDSNYREIKTPGKPGRRTVSYEVDMRNGVEISRKEIQTVETEQPVKQVEIVGAKPRGAYTTPGQNEIIVWDFLINHGFSRQQTAGIMGNLKQEHGFNTTGDGLAQWTGGRKAALMSRSDPYNITTQLEFLMSELSGSYSRVQTNLKACSTVECSVEVFQNQFERCGICAESRRIEYAYNILASH